MKILHLHENFEIKGGSEVYLHNLNSELNERDINSSIITINKLSQNSTIKIQTSNGINQEVPFNELFLFLNNFLLKEQFDLVHIHGISNPSLIKYFLRKLPAIRSMHEPRLVCPGHEKFWLHSEKPCNIKYGAHCFWHAYTQKCCNSRYPLYLIRAYFNTRFEVLAASLQYKYIIVMSEFMRQLAIEGGIEESKIITNPYFTKKIPFQENKHSSKRIFYAGRLVKHKGIHLLLDAAIPLLKEHSDLFIDIVGDGLLYEELVKKVVNNGLTSQVIFHGWKNSEEINQIMSLSTIVVFPSIYPEAFGIVGIEAFMHSKPVIAFNVGGISTWLQNGFNGYLLDNITMDTLRESIRSILYGDDKRYEIMCKNAWESVNRNFTSVIHINKLIAVYNNSIKS